MTDLVKRLRAGCVTGNYEGLEFIEWAKSNATMNEAADRIEQLEALLDEEAFSQTLFDAVVSQRNKANACIEQLEAALQALKAMHREGGIDDIEERDDRTYFMVCNALESLK